MKYYIKKKSRVNIITLMKKIKLISSIDDEYCKFIVKQFNNYIKYMSEYSKNINYLKVFEKHIDNFDDELINSNVIFTSNATSIINKLIQISNDKKVEIIYFIDKNSNENLIKLNELIKGKNISSILTENFNRNKIKRIIKKDKPSNMFILVDINIFEEVNNWYTIMKDKTEKILISFLSNRDENIIKDPIGVSKQSIYNSNSQKSILKKQSNIIIEKFVKNLIYLKRLCVKMNIQFGINYKQNTLISSITNLKCIDNSNKVILTELIELIGTLKYLDTKEMYSHIYDILYQYLENDIKMYNYCDFKNNECIAKRDSYNNVNYPKSQYNGCCYNLDTLKDCKYLKNNECEIKCISCRLFTCKYLKERGIDYNIYKNLQIKCFTKMLYRPIFVWNFYTDKAVILGKIKK